MIKVGLIGGGGIASAHIRGYAAHADRIAVTAIADAVPETVERRAAELGAQGFADYRADDHRQQTSTPSTSACRTICTGTRSSRQPQAGKHILCEKPLCLSPTEAVEVQDGRRRTRASP